MKQIYYIDNSGRITVPKKIRKRLGLECGEGVVITVVGEKMMIEKLKLEEGNAV